MYVSTIRTTKNVKEIMDELHLVVIQLYVIVARQKWVDELHWLIIRLYGRKKGEIPERVANNLPTIFQHPRGEWTVAGRRGRIKEGFVLVSIIIRPSKRLDAWMRRRIW